MREFPRFLSFNSTSWQWRHQKISFFQHKTMLSMKRTFSLRSVLVVIRRVGSFELVRASKKKETAKKSSLVCSSTVEGEKKNSKNTKMLVSFIFTDKKEDFSPSSSVISLLCKINIAFFPFISFFPSLSISLSLPISISRHINDACCANFVIHSNSCFKISLKIKRKKKRLVS